ncbi:hypothetical protein LCGC14_1937470, partial [marine sediment metagenome]
TDQWIGVKDCQVVTSDPELEGLLSKLPDPAHTCVEFITREPIEMVLIQGDPRRPKDKTTARVLCTAEGLYVFFHCTTSSPAGAAWSRKTRDTDVWFDNNVEIFLSPDAAGGRDYYQITVNPGGTVFDARARDKAWNGELAVATSIRRGSWTVEVGIPFKSLGLSGRPDNKVWRMNLTRLNTDTGEDTSWCVLGDYRSHTPSRFGYLWVDAGAKVNVPPQDMQPWRRLFNGRDLAGWKLIHGKARVGKGEIRTGYQGQARLLWTEPVPHDDFVVTADVQVTGQLRFMFSPDPANRKVGYFAAFINGINESNVALLRDWEYWNPPLGGHLTIPQVGPCPMQEGRWYRCEVHFRPDRVRLILDGRVLMESANLFPKARYFGLDMLGEGRLKNVRLRRLLSGS